MLSTSLNFLKTILPACRQLVFVVFCILLAFHPAIRFVDADDATDKVVTGAGVLPSENKAESLPVRPREILAEVGIGQEELESIHHTEAALEETESRTLILQILYRLAAIPLRSLEYWGNKNSKTETLAWDEQVAIGKTFSLKGQIKEIDPISLSEKDQSRFGKTTVYRCQVSFPGSEGSHRAILYTSVIPHELPVGEPIDASGGALAIYLGNDDKTNNRLFVASRLAWYPDTLLGDLQMDVSLLESIQNSKPLRGEEFEAFYQMLSAAKRTAAGELPRRAYNQLRYETKQIKKKQRQLEAINMPLSEDERIEEALLETRLEYMRKNASHPFVPLVEYPDQFNGELIMLRGTAYRIVKVRISEPEIRKRFGIDHYYQIDMRVNLEHKVKLVTSHTAEGKEETIREEKIVTQHPATFCALSLPTDMPTGDHLLEPIRVAGFYFKNWQYQTAEMRGDQAAERVAPMLIGRQPVWDVRKPNGLEKYGGFIVGISFLLVLLGIWGIVWWTGRRDLAFGKKLRQASGGDTPPVFDAEIETEGKLSFLSQIEDDAPPGVGGENDA